MYVPQKLNGRAIPRTDLAHPGHLAKMHQNAAPAPVAIRKVMKRA